MADTIFPPNQDMADVTPADVADAKKRAAQEKAYNAATTKTKPNPKPKQLASGGSVRGDGIAQRGKTKGRMV